MSELTGQIIVFISSVQNKNIENLDSDRSEVIKTVKNHSSTIPWAFEHTPSSDLPPDDYYLRGVSDSHLFILLIGEQTTKAVMKEYGEAVRLNKPVFAFVKDVKRSSEADTLLTLVLKRSKYSVYKSVDDLSDLVKLSLNEFFSRLVKDNQMQKEYPEVMRVLADGKFALQLQEYAQRLLNYSSVSFEEEVTHYLERIPESLRDASKFYIPMKAKPEFGASETIDTLLEKHKRLVVLGLPGSGKTIELLNLTMRLSKIAAKETGPKRLPIYVNMRFWKQNDIISHVETLFKEYGLHFERSKIITTLENNNVVFLFDGLDEVPPNELADKVNQILFIAQSYKNVEIIVSCRIGRDISDFNFPVVTLEPLQDSEIFKYMAEFTLQEFNMGKFYSWTSSLRELSRHPLMLNFIANILTEGEEPTSQADIYTKYIDFLFTRWEINKGARIDAIWKKLSLVRLATYMQAESNYSVSENEAIGQLQEVISGESVDFSSVQLLNELVSSGMIRKELNKYTFWHASFREFLASQLIIDRIKNHESIYEFVLNPSWEPVIIFASALFEERSEISYFLFEILNSDLYLYSRCLKNILLRSFSVVEPSDEDVGKFIFNEIMDVRARIIERWFPALSGLINQDIYSTKDSHTAIVGKYSSEGSGYILYGYSTLDKIGSKVRLLSEFPPETTMNSLLNSRLISSSVSRGLPATEARVAGAHKIALEDLWGNLKELIHAMSLIEPPKLMYEQTQNEVSLLIREHIISIVLPANISLIETNINNLIRGYGTGQVTISMGHNDIHLNNLFLRLKLLSTHGYTRIGESVLPNPDRRLPNGGWITQQYEDETLLNYVELYFQNVLDGYSEMVKLNFSELFKRLVHAQLLPVRVVAEVKRPKPSKDIKSMGGCDYYFEPLETGFNNIVIVTLNQKISDFPSPSSSDPYDLMNQWIQKLKRYGRWNSSMYLSTSRSLLSVFFNEPNTIRKSVYDWVLKDLEHIFELKSFGI